jgi:hypothetical protein
VQLNVYDSHTEEVLMAKYWMGDVGEKDDFGDPIKDEFIDGVTTDGRWGIMSPHSFRNHGRGTGTGFGQRYKRVIESDKPVWLKVEG